MAQDFSWTGTHVQGSTACAVVKYHGATDRRGSRWIATIKRDSQTIWRASVPFEEGPIAAALTVCIKQKLDWAPTSCHSIDADTYAIGF